MTTILIKVNKAFDGFLPGRKIQVECDSKGIPLMWLWRRRLKDAEFDQCCEIVKPEEKAAEKPKRTSKSKHQETE